MVPKGSINVPTKGWPLLVFIVSIKHYQISNHPFPGVNSFWPIHVQRHLGLPSFLSMALRFVKIARKHCMWLSNWWSTSHQNSSTYESYEYGLVCKEAEPHGEGWISQGHGAGHTTWWHQTSGVNYRNYSMCMYVHFPRIWKRAAQ